MLVKIAGEFYKVNSNEEILQIMMNNCFSRSRSLFEYVIGLKKRIKNFYGDDVTSLNYNELIMYLVDKGELKLMGNIDN